MVYNGYYKVMSNIPKMGRLPTPVLWQASAQTYLPPVLIDKCIYNTQWMEEILHQLIGGLSHYL